MPRYLPPVQTIFRQSLKQFVTMEPTELSLLQNCTKISDLTITTPRMRTALYGQTHSSIWLRVRIKEFMRKIIAKQTECLIFLRSATGVVSQMHQSPPWSLPFANIYGENSVPFLQIICKYESRFSQASISSFVRIASW